MNPFRIHYLQHVPFEGLGYIENWAREKGLKLSATKLFEFPSFPDLEEFDWLIVMGGPMSVYDELDYPWLKAEKTFIKSAIDANKTVIGICLGSQLIAAALGAKVYRNKKKEIGWFPVSLTQPALQNQFLNGFPETITVFHWHGDTFDLPNGAAHLMKSAICTNQAFLYKGKVVGLQFHLEMIPMALKEMIKNCQQELITDDYIHTEEEILKNTSLCSETNKYLASILNKLAM